MSSVIISGDTSGTVSLTVPAVAGTNTATLPAATGTVMVSGNMPAFSAYTSASQSLSSGTATKIQFNTELFDTNSNFDSATNYRFTPTVAGYYQVTLNVQMLATLPTLFQIFIYKNGANYTYQTNATPSNGNTLGIGQLVYCNGSTDYIEAYAKIAASSGISIVNDQTSTIFSACLMRTA